jgi:hypothetical protein
MPNTETIGKFTFSVAFGEPAPEARSRFERRVDALTAWLLAQWRKQHQEGRHGDASDN